MEPDEIIHQALCLKIMSALHAVGEGEPLEFTGLRGIVNATDGNLGGRLTTLEKAGYVKITKDFVGKKPRTRVAMTAAGRRAFTRHIAYLRDIVESANATPGDRNAE